MRFKRENLLMHSVEKLSKIVLLTFVDKKQTPGRMFEQLDGIAVLYQLTDLFNKNMLTKQMPMPCPLVDRHNEDRGQNGMEETRAPQDILFNFNEKCVSRTAIF